MLGECPGCCSISRLLSDRPVGVLTAKRRSGQSPCPLRLQISLICRFAEETIRWLVSSKPPGRGRRRTFVPSVTAVGIVKPKHAVGKESNEVEAFPLAFRVSRNNPLFLSAQAVGSPPHPHTTLQHLPTLNRRGPVTSLFALKGCSNTCTGARCRTRTTPWVMFTGWRASYPRRASASGESPPS